MSIWDKILPHRFLINRALRTASDELRDHIDSYRVEHELAIQRCYNEIEAAKAEKDRQFELLKKDYLNELSQDSHVLGELQSLFLEYADAHMKKKLLYFSKEKMTLKLQLLNKYSGFLTEQMHLIGEEITILEQRQKALALQVKIDDVVTLIRMTGYSLPCDDSDTPKTLLEKVNSILSECNDLLPQTKAALQRLRMLLQERAEYLPLIQYISWLIQQKKNFSQELSRERRGIKEEKKPLKEQISAINAEMELLNKTMLNQAIRVRNVWAVPMADIYMELSNIDAALNDNYSRIKTIQSEINYMKETRSNDSNKWENLWAEKKSLSNAIGQLKNDKTKLYEQLNQWFNRKNTIIGLFKRNNVFLLSPKGEKTTDEIRVLKWRQSELYEKIEDINHILEENTSKILSERYQQETVLSDQINAADKTISEKKSRLAKAENQVKKLEAQDDRFFIAKLLSESQDVSKAKTHRDQAKKELKQAEQSFFVLQNKLQAINAACEQQLSDNNKQYEREKKELQENVTSIDLAIAFIQKKRK